MRTFLSFSSFIIIIFLISACDVFEESPPLLNSAEEESFLLRDKRDNKFVPLLNKSDELVVITVNSNSIYNKNYDGKYVGLEFDLASEFGKELGKRVRFVVAPDTDKALTMLEKNQGHLATGISATTKNKLQVRFGPGYQRVQPQVAYNTNHLTPKNIQEIAGKNIEIVRGTVHGERLSEAKLKTPELRWTETNISTEDLLSKLADGKVDYVVTDSTNISVAKNFYSNLGVAISLGKENTKAWAFSLSEEPELQKRIEEFFKRIEEDGTLNRLIDRYYGHIQRLGQENINKFLEKTRTFLPSLRKHFYQAEEITKIDWRLIAALSYQESHWDRKATSFTNVRGIMMLTKATAERMKVTDRLDARQNILAGARYLLILKNTLPSRIVEPDRTWIALAAYNQGYGHIEDARILAQRMKLSPDLWVDLKRSLPLLSHRRHFENLKFGYARGGEAVYLTESVRAYYDILKKYESPYKQNASSPRILNQE
jgi:membrane-bound lytic murein transglycosylase F